MKASNAFLGILAGIATGALIGILVAPDKGSRTRRKILNKSEDLNEMLNDKVEELTDMIETMTEKVKNIKQETKELLSKGKLQYDNIKETN
jgi:gas vesicle protein